MPPVERILAQRQARRKKASRDAKPGWGLASSIFFSLFLALVCFAAAWTYNDIQRGLPNVFDLAEYLSPPNGSLLQPTRLFDRNGEHVILVLQNPAATGQARLDAQRQGVPRKYLYLGKSGETEQKPEQNEIIPTSVISATLAVSDPGFFQHNGFSWDGLLDGRHTTLAQKLVFDLLLSGEEPGLRRNLRERYLAFQATSSYGRNKILEYYLNSANFGRLAYGIEEASTLYFNHPASQLSLAEAAMLAGVSQRPDINPQQAPQAALEAQKRVIQSMLDLRLVTPEIALQAIQEQLATKSAARTGQSLQITELSPNFAAAFSHQAIAELDQILGRSRYERGGLKIITTLDWDIHNQAINTADVINTQSEVVVLDPQSGQLLALSARNIPWEVGSKLSNHASGTLSTPFVGLAAFTHGMSPATLIWDTPSATASTPDDMTVQYHGPVRLRVALANDYPASLNKILRQVGADNLSQIGAGFGFSAAAGEKTAEDFFAELDILQASRAYGIFANQGILAGRTTGNDEQNLSQTPFLKPVTILDILDLKQESLYHHETAQNLPVLTPQMAYLVNHVLKDEPARWPTLGRENPLVLEYPAAIKLSQNRENHSAWVIGYSRNRVIGVWLGTEKNAADHETQKMSAAAVAAATLWKDVARTVFSRQSFPAWSVPAGISTLEVCDPSGLLPTPECPNTVSEVFFSGSEPQQADTLFQKIKLNRQAKTLATVFTPLNLIDEQVFMVIPEDEENWLQSTGLPQPPEVYDTIPAEPPAWPGQHISSPTMFQQVAGKIKIQGAASADDLSFFRIQVGQGLNPNTWLQLGADRLAGQHESILETWDTSGMDGIYTIQLLLVKQDQTIQRTSVVVTVDNQAPVISALHPMQGEILPIPQNGDLILRADIQDNLLIQEVVFYLDGEQIGKAFQPPFITAWPPQAGEHHLRIVAADKAGNEAELTSFFIIK